MARPKFELAVEDVIHDATETPCIYDSYEGE